MPHKLRLGLASLVHDHVWGELGHWLSNPEVDVVAVGEPSQRLRVKAHEKGVPHIYDSWQAMLEAEDLDIVQAASDNATAADIVEAAMAKGAHLVSEKPMSATLEQANRMMASAARHGKLLMINWPNVWDSAFQEWERMLLAGEIGRIIHLKRRNAHNGPKEIGCDPAFVEWLYDEQRNGAGALMDYCCYGADIAARFLGLPATVTGMRAVLAKEYYVPDDNAVILMHYERAFAQAEASWTEIAGAPGPSTVAYGTEGSCSIVGSQVVLHKAGSAPQTIDPPALVAPMRNAPEYFLHCLQSEVPIEGFCSAKVSWEAQAILEAGLISSNTGRHVTVADLPSA